MVLAAALLAAWAATGDLTQKAGLAGCISDTGSGGDCADGTGLDNAWSVTVSPDGKSAYAVADVSSAVSVFDRAADGTLTQKAGLAGCISEDGSGGDCTDGRALLGAESVIVSPDGKSVYVASYNSGAVAVFDRAADGTLTQKAGLAGCISDDGSGGDCTDGKALDDTFSVTVSPDGKSVYTANGGMAVFDRAADGTLIQKPGLAGCISDTGSGGDCTDGRALDGVGSVIVSPDGKSAYVASANSGAVAVFDRAADGTLAQKAGLAGCISEDGSGGDCSDGKALDGVNSVTVSPDGKSVYAASYGGDAVAVFDRAADGTLAQKAGTDGCVSETGSGGDCSDGKGLDNASWVTVSPDGKSAYATSAYSDAVAVFDRAPNGTLTQKAGLAGCISETGSGGDCTDGKALSFAYSVTVSPDGKSVYTASLASGAVAVFDRETPAPPSSYHDVVLGDAPAGYWRFGEPSGTTLVDSSPNHNNGTYLGGVALGAPGALVASGDLNTAATYDGVNDTGRVADSATLHVGSSFTVEGWVSRGSTAKSYELFNKGANGIQLSLMNAGSGNKLFLRKAGVTTIAQSSIGILADGYHYVVATMNGAGTAKIYVDGVDVTQSVSAVQAIADTAFPLTFGNAAGAPAKFDEFALYDSVLTPAQVSAHYAAAH